VHAACGICGGELVLRYPGSGRPLDSSLLSPTNHRPGEHPDLYRCAGCGTLQQAPLPEGAELVRMYRAMRDDAYLQEEPGRRRTARRVLDKIAPHAPRGRLLDVGCGPGLLLDEARALGFEVEGLELSRSAAAFARGRLRLTVHDVPLEEFEPDGEPFDAVVLADVLEHLADPVAALRRCRDLLAPGGVLCLVTPDPSSVTARVAGARWWGLLPAHTFLVPRATLRLLAAAEGFELVDDSSLVRSFTTAYWLGGLAERGGRMAAVVRGARRAVPRRLMLSLSLGDERVIVATRGVQVPTRPAPASGPGRAPLPPRTPAAPAVRAARARPSWRPATRSPRAGRARSE